MDEGFVIESCERLMFLECDNVRFDRHWSLAKASKVKLSRSFSVRVSKSLSQLLDCCGIDCKRSIAYIQDLLLHPHCCRASYKRKHAPNPYRLVGGGERSDIELALGNERFQVYPIEPDSQAVVRKIPPESKSLALEL